MIVGLSSAIFLGMKRSLLKLALVFFHGIIWFKRGLVYTAQVLTRGFDVIGVWILHAVAVPIYKFFIPFWKKFSERHLGNGIRQLFARCIVTGGMVGLVGGMVSTETRLFDPDPTEFPGRGSILYTWIGPIDEEVIEEEGLSTVGYLEEENTYWGAGVLSQQSAVVIEQPLEQATDFFSTVQGGTALVKPTIIPGAEVAKNPTRVEEYVVQSGDTLIKIAEEFGVNVETILWENDLTIRSYIRPGDTLRILPVSGIRYRIAKRDTVEKIARLYAVAATEIVRLNGLEEEGSNLVVGEYLIIPGGKKLSTPSARQRALVDRSTTRSIPGPSSASKFLGMIWPSTIRRITQYFGWRHTGIDIAGPVGTPIYAADAGTVIRSQCGWNGGYGCYVIIDHGGALHTLYGHASRLFVTPGESVAKGQTIALMGSTGRSTGSHVHFEVRTSGRRVNPLGYVR